MNVYDFDGTIYDGDSSIDFYLHCVSHHPSIILAFPRQLKGFVMYGCRKISKTSLKEHYFSFLRFLKNPENDVADFWKKNKNKIKAWYLRQKEEDDVIISASPKFLLEPVLHSMGVENVIASNVNIKTGGFASENCHDTMKPIYFRNQFPNAIIDNFYSDSNSDAPMAEISNNAFLVKDNELKEWRL